MYSLGTEPNTGRLNARNMVTGVTSVSEIGPVYKVHIDHASAIVRHDHMVGGSLTILQSVAPWESIPFTSVVYGRKLSNSLYSTQDMCIIEDRIFGAINNATSMSEIYVQDVTDCHLLVPICVRDSSKHTQHFTLSTASWRGHTWMSAGVSWGAQNPESRELFTCVDMNAGVVDYDPGWCPRLATGDGRLYGLVTMNGPRSISALDPRETSVAKIIYADHVGYNIDHFRDVPGGIAVLPILQHYSSYSDIISIFDERSCAMIGTSMSLNSRWLFCTCAFEK